MKNGIRKNEDIEYLDKIRTINKAVYHLHSNKYTNERVLKDIPKKVKDNVKIKKQSPTIFSKEFFIKP